MDEFVQFLQIHLQELQPDILSWKSILHFIKTFINITFYRFSGCCGFSSIKEVVRDDVTCWPTNINHNLCFVFLCSFSLEWIVFHHLFSKNGLFLLCIRNTKQIFEMWLFLTFLSAHSKTTCHSFWLVNFVQMLNRQGLVLFNDCQLSSTAEGCLQPFLQDSLVSFERFMEPMPCLVDITKFPLL